MADKEIVAAMTISGIGMVDYMAKCKMAEKDGWVLVGNPMMTDNIINQQAVKYS